MDRCFDAPQLTEGFRKFNQVAGSVHHCFVVDANVHRSFGADRNQQSVCLAPGRAVDEPRHGQEDAAITFPVVGMVELGFLRKECAIAFLVVRYVVRDLAVRPRK